MTEIETKLHEALQRMENELTAALQRQLKQIEDLQRLLYQQNSRLETLTQQVEKLASL